MATYSGEVWICSLVQALARVHEIESEYLDELAERRWQRERAERDVPSYYRLWDPARDIDSFYHHACYSEGNYFKRRYAHLRAALRDATQIVGLHPALATVLRADERGHEFLVCICNRGQGNSRLSMVAGLMCRVKQVGEDGFRIASCELKSLLDLSLEEGVDRNSNNLTDGYHVSLFYGLEFNKEIEIADGMKAVPLEQTSAFLNRNVLHHVAPSIVSDNNWKAVGAILKPFRWKPLLLSLGDETAAELDWGGSFPVDARAFTEILSVSHGVPIVSLMGIPYCTDRTASLLLGQSHYHSGIGWMSWARSFAGLREAHQLDTAAFDQARQVHLESNGDRYHEHAPVISRLSEALARTGQYAADDKILDVAIALEQMYALEQGEISYKLKTRAACFLRSDTQARLRVFKSVGQFYEERSRIVHKHGKKRRKMSSGKTKDKAFKKGFDVARESVFKLLRKGRPPNWDQVVIAGTKGPETAEAEGGGEVSRT